MVVFLRADTNIIAFLLLGAVFLLAIRSMDRHDRLNRKFLSTSLIVLIEIAAETAICFINGRPETWLVAVSSALYVCMFTTAPILACIWFMFIYDWIVPDQKLTMWKIMLLLTPVALNAVLTVLSPVYGFIFYFDDAHIYHRGSLFVAYSAITYVYLLHCFAIIMRRRRKIIRQDFVPILIACIIPSVGGLFQTVFYGPVLMWSSCAYALVIVYIYLQKRMIHLDSLTGAWTRGSFDYFISHKVEHTADRFGVILADMDNLKTINDDFGHCEGDMAIQTSVRLIRNALRKTDVLARTGGDEFIVVMDCGSAEALDVALERIKAGFDEHNARADAEYRLECSFGAAMYDPGYASVEQFLREVDRLMYSHKKGKRPLEA